ncbi:MAG: hypothetical protein ACRCVW_07030 [Brevinema sp.]
MKKIFLLLVFILSVANLHATLGRHNLQVNVLSGYHYTETQTPYKGGYIFNGITSMPGGGVIGLELNYMLHSVRESGTIHGLDIRSFFKADFAKGLVQKIPNLASCYLKIKGLTGGLTLSYSVGKKLKSGRLMFDILGFGIQGGSHKLIAKLDSRIPALMPSIKVSANYNFLGVNYVIPGISYILDNGFTFAWRNSLGFNILLQHMWQPKLTIDSYISLGYTFGK